MAAISSAPRGDRLVGAGAWALALVGTWSLPPLLGLALAAAAMGLGSLTDSMAHGLLALHAIGWILIYSPILSWMGLIPLVPLAWMLLRHGRAGWASIMVAGVVAGMAALVPLSAIGGGSAAGIVLPFGAFSALVLRAILARVAPTAFATATGPDGQR
jgi:hypothetical protein